MKTRQVITVLIAGVLTMTLQAMSANEAGVSDQSGERPAAPMSALTSVDFRQVKVGGEIGRRMDLTVDHNILELDWEHVFLGPFRTRDWPAGQCGEYGAYVGIGKTLDATVRLAKYTGRPDVRKLKDHIVEELLKTQEDGGYIGNFRPDARIKTLWDLHEMVYLMHALVDDYTLFGQKRSLEAARKLGDFIMRSRRGTDEPRGTGKLNTERAFIALARATGEPKYRDYAVDGMDLLHWRDPVGGHAYTFMNVCVAQLDLYREHHAPALLEQSHRVLEYLTQQDGLLVSGTCSMGEGFHNNQDGRGNLGESCATAYLMRMLHHLIQLEGKSAYGDLLERSAYNALFAAQSPDGRQLRYFTCQEGPRVYFPKDYYCCPGNWRRIVAELPDMVYYALTNGLAVNLYTPSQATLGEGADAVVVRQETDYPSAGLVTIMVDPARAMKFPLLLRIPRWCAQATAKVNGKIVDGAVKAGEFLRIERTWQRGDKVTLDLPMPWRFIAGRKTQAGRAAIMRGPVVYSLSPGRITTSAIGAAPAAPPLGSDIDLKRLVLLPATIEPVVADVTVRPGGTACRIKADLDKAGQGAFTLTLTEFPDPDGQATYFQLADPNAAVADELLAAAQ